MAKRPRGIRNNNPGNLEYTGIQWQGLDNPPSDGRFCTFKKPEWGIRAMARNLLTYQEKHGLRTIRAIIGRWAPAPENDVDAYVNSVSLVTGILPDWQIDLRQYDTMAPLVEAMILHENGEQPYTPDVISRGLKMVGIEVPDSPAPSVPPAPPQKPGKIDTGEIWGIVAAAFGLGGLAAAEEIEAVRRVSESLSGSLNLPWLDEAVLAVLGVAGIGFFAYRRIRKATKEPGPSEGNHTHNRIPRE